MPDELPQHNVTLTGFYIYTHEVTNALYQACVTAGACLPPAGLPDSMADYASNAAYAGYPVAGVDWNMSHDYCVWAGGRLPTEAEWEVAARGADAPIYPWGNTAAACDTAGIQDCGTGLHPFEVGSFALGNSPFEVWDMAGNVWEWVNDWYAPTPYTSAPVTNPIGPWSGEYKVVRGGGWNSSPESVRSAMRLGTSPSDAYGDVGFRCVPNGLPVPEDIASTDGSHSVHTGGGRNLEGGGTLENIQKGVIDYTMMQDGTTTLDGLQSAILRPYPDKIRELVDKIFGSGTMQPMASGTVEENMQAEAARVVVINGTGVGGMAERTSTYLKTQGMNVTGVGNTGDYPDKYYSPFNDRTIIIVHAGKPYAMQYLMALMKFNTTSQIIMDFDPNAPADILVGLGTDWGASNPMP
jgi:hypothetical protein